MNLMSTVTANVTRAQGWLARLISLLRQTDPDFTELLSGVIGFFWGLWLLNPLWETFASGRGFAAMAAIAPEEYWGAAILAGGMFQIYAVLREELGMRFFAAMGAVATWALVASMIAVSNFAGTGIVVYSMICISQLWAAWRIADRQGLQRGP